MLEFLFFELHFRKKDKTSVRTTFANDIKKNENKELFQKQLKQRVRTETTSIRTFSTFSKNKT